MPIVAVSGVAWGQVLVLLLPLPVAVTTNLAVAARRPALRTFNQVVLLAIPAFVAVLGLLEPLGDARLVGNAIGLVLTAAVGLAIQVPVVAKGLRRVLPYDPGNQVHVLALVLSVLVAGSQLTTEFTTDVLATAARGSALSRTDLVLQEIPFLLGAVVGVGFLTRRGTAATLDRLGLVLPPWWQVVLALAAAGLFVAFGDGMDRLGQWLTPGLAHRVGEANDRLFGHLADPGGIVTIALAAGICEETLFRGALQPRFGLLWPALVFTAVHTQYGLSFDTAAVLILALGLGLLRRFANTTTSAICHIAYDATVGFGFGVIGLGGAVALELVLVATLVAAYVVHRARRRSRLLTGGVGTAAPPK